MTYATILTKATHLLRHNYEGKIEDILTQESFHKEIRKYVGTSYEFSALAVICKIPLRHSDETITEHNEHIELGFAPSVTATHISSVPQIPRHAQLIALLCRNSLGKGWDWRRLS